MKKSRVEDAVRLFESGYNCCQSVFAAYAGLYGMDKDEALMLSSTLGAGVGRMREVCGTVLAMALLYGLIDGNADPEDQAKKEAVYQRVRDMSDEFARRNGSIICKELLGIPGREESAAPSIRTKEFYEKRPCAGFIRCAAEIIESNLGEEFL